MRPINLTEARKRGLLTEDGKGIHTWSNGTEHECWASGNCFQCSYWHPDIAGELCALEAAATLGIVSPELARLFGWTPGEGRYDAATDVLTTDYPDECPFFRDKDQDGDSGPPPDPDPLQLVLIADPTEDAALIQNAPIESPAVAVSGSVAAHQPAGQTWRTENR